MRQSRANTGAAVALSGHGSVSFCHVKISFVVPPMLEGRAHARPEVFTPLGFLSLGAVAERLGHDVTILDLNLFIQDGTLMCDHDALGPAVNAILETRPDVVGFTTMCTTYPRSLRLVRELARRAPDIRILLGGPQATAVDVDTLRAFPEVHGIVRGEAESSFAGVLRWCAGELEGGRAPGLTYRDGDDIRRNPDAPLIEDLDALPEPAWHLYPIEKVVPLPVDIGRGCPFECTFCTTNLFFRRKYRMKSPGRILSECQKLMELTGQRRFFFVHDLFTVNRRMVVTICEALIRAGLDIEWRSSARVDLVDEELLSLLARSGCKNLFFGIETGSEERQREIKKRIKVKDVVPKLEAAIRLGIEPTASFIVGFPDETIEDLQATAEMAWALTRAGVGDLYIHNLLPLPGAAVTDRHRHELKLEERPDWLLPVPRADWEMVRSHPELFSGFHVFPRRGPWLLRQIMMHGADWVRKHHARRGRSFVRIGAESLVPASAPPATTPGE